MVRVVRPNAPYLVTISVHAFPTNFGNQRPFRLHNSHLDTLRPILGPLGSKFGYLRIDKVVRIISSNYLFPVPTLFHLFPTNVGHQRLLRPNNSHIDPFGPILGTMGSKFGYLWVAKEVRVVSPYIPYPVWTLFHLVQTILDHLGLKKGPYPVNLLCLKICRIWIISAVYWKWWSCFPLYLCYVFWLQRWKNNVFETKLIKGTDSSKKIAFFLYI